MLPAPPTAAPASTTTSSTSTVPSRQASIPWATIFAAMLMLYAISMGWGLISGKIPPERANLLLAVPCLAPMLWCFAGVIRGLGSHRDAGEQDTGLLLSAVGWLLLALGFGLKHLAVMRALPDAYAVDATSPLTPLCIGLGIVCLLLGVVISTFAWIRDDE